jgi:hypothetical protein
MFFYTGVGSRETPIEIKRLMTRIASCLSKKDYILRSGGAKGADLAFEKGTIEKEIFYAKDSTQESENIAKRFHPKWDSCSNFVKKLHGRNAFQVLGKDLKTPSKFLICWTKDGCTNHKNRTIKTGGTGTAISIADHYNIPVWNLAIDQHKQKFIKACQEVENGNL